MSVEGHFCDTTLSRSLQNHNLQLSCSGEEKLCFFLIYIYMYIKRVNIKCGRKSEYLRSLSTSILKALL